MSNLVNYIFGSTTDYSLNAYTVLSLVCFIMIVYLLTALVNAFSNWGGR